MILWNSISNLDSVTENNSKQIFGGEHPSSKKSRNHWTPSPRKPDVNIVCKLFKKIIRVHLMEHPNDNEILLIEQFGFLPGKWSQLQLLRVLDDFTETVDRRKEFDVVYLDFKRAFDSVPHRKLV